LLVCFGFSLKKNLVNLNGQNKTKQNQKQQQLLQQQQQKTLSNIGVGGKEIVMNVFQLEQNKSKYYKHVEKNTTMSQRL